MVLTTTIGTGVVGKIVAYIVEPVGSQVGYLIYYNRNLKKLWSELRDLDAARESVERKIVEEERKGRTVETTVTNWLTDVNEITGKAKEFLKDEHQVKIKCLHGFCPNLMVRRHLSKKSTKLVQDVAELYGKKEFSNIAYDNFQKDEVCEISCKDYEDYDSRTSVLKKIMDELRNSSPNIIGVYGIGGVGKTTLVKKVYIQSKRDENLFDEVVMVPDLKQDSSIEQIQKVIFEKLGLDLHEVETPVGRARHICNRIKGKKTLVILDDVWEYIDLEAVGLPPMPTLKIMLTSRTKIVLSRDMSTQKEFHLDVLDKKETWSLFQKMAGDIVKKIDIQTVAIQVAEKCGGLLLMIVTVARALKKRPLHAWKDALRRLKRLDGQGLTEKAYSTIEWSYNKLDNEELKSLFMLCGVVVCKTNNTNTFFVSDLWKYSIGLGLLKNVDTIGEASDALNSLLEQLKEFCLLLDGDDDNTCVRIHDIVKDVAKGIASRDQHVLSLTHGAELKEWPAKEFWENCTMINLDRCNIPKLPDVLQCQKLTFFCLDSNNDSSQEIPSNFFKEMKKLKVLDLTSQNMSSLPSSLQFLKNLRTLCLDGCTLGDIALVGQLQNLEILSFLNSKFNQLPNEIGQLIRLRLLDLTDCSQLEVISPNVLSSLKRLEQLRMGNSFNRWEVGQAIGTERSNANLEELKHLNQLTALQIHIPDANTLPADLFRNKLERFQICIGSAWKWADMDDALNSLKLKLTTSNKLDHGLKLLLNRTEDLYLEGTEGVNNGIVYQLDPDAFQKLKHLHVQNNAEFTNVINGKVAFSNLTLLAVSELNGLRFLLLSSTARSLAQLKHLQISGCQIMEEIVSIDESDEEIAENMFFQLQHLELKDLPNLTKFCSSRSDTEMPNTSFERLQVQNSSKLDKVTFGPVNKSTTSCEIEESDTKANPDIVLQPFLFDTKVEFPNMKKLFIDGLNKLTTIWNNELPIESSKHLESVEVVSCMSLKSIFPASVARSLQQLRRLIVRNCGVEEIVSNEDTFLTTNMFGFPKLTHVRFECLPRLRDFYPGLHVSNWPSLITLTVYGCDKALIFAEGTHEFNNLCTPNRQSLFLVEKDSFPNLETLALDVTENWDRQPLHLFKKLKTLYTYADNNLSVNSLENLIGLEKLNGSYSGEIHAVGGGTLPHLRKLGLYRMRKLMHLGEDSSRPTSPNFPKLEILELQECDSLKNLISSAISFKNLTTLQVSFCKRLKYLITYSMAKSLMQLTKLEVVQCSSLREIVGNNEEQDDGDDSGIEIAFEQLKHLKLSVLPRLRGFCSRNYSVKFPSLETLSISKRLKLMIFPLDETLQTTDEEEDTDVEKWEKKLTADENNIANTELIS
ncbi:hypothetical protein M0R45_006057 [Rubus argutus]|uniref:AAA+ ATPase domain-containing protein n=1 Tax=Rubus argutus TaxID=59490 RepID=A0AAW1YPX5_RUBAR